MLEAPAQRVELLVAIAPRTWPLKVRVRHLGGELNGREATGDARTQALVGRETVADRSALKKKD